MNRKRKIVGSLQLLLCGYGIREDTLQSSHQYVQVTRATCLEGPDTSGGHFGKGRLQMESGCGLEAK